MNYIVFFDETEPDTNLLGGKGSNIVRLSKNYPKIPPGFIITTESYQNFLKNSGKFSKFMELLGEDFNPKSIMELSKELKNLILNTQIPYEVLKEIIKGYNELKYKSKEFSNFAVRSSANIEDQDLLSFAGQAETYLHIKTFDDLIDSIKKCWASLFSPQALFYILKMREKGLLISLKDVKMAVIIQEMINSQISGVLFTSNVLNNDTTQMMINSTWGLGETIANNSVNPDLIILNKKRFKIIKTMIGRKEKQSIQNPKGSYTVIIDTNLTNNSVCSLNKQQIRQLYDIGLNIENIFNCPQDIEWAIENNEIYLLQTRPITTVKN
jgi:pyruvate,water dikinase